MMLKKALLFGDGEVAELIMEQTSPRKQKFLGRQVRGFDQSLWLRVCEDIMVPALVSKFTQDPYSLKCMMESIGTTIVEASPVDKIWGIGMTKDDRRATDPAQWDGLNLLGNVLMRARDEIVDR